MKPITFAELKRIQKLSLNEFNRWITALCKEIYEDGLREGESEFDDVAILTEERLMEIMLSVKGIGKKLMVYHSLIAKKYLLLLQE